jgi:hypothetical protein
VCGEHLAVTRLGCGACGTELAGVFAACEFCALDDKDVATLRVFLASRGNLRELERHLGVSYPTARQRFNDLLQKLGLGEPVGSVATDPGPDADRADPGDLDDVSAAAPLTRDEILAQVAAGTLAPAEATRLLTGSPGR